MFIVRTVMSCKPGKVGELVARFKALNEVLKEMGFPPFRLYTDMAGAQFWTMVAVHDYETLDSIEELQNKVMTDKRAQAAMDGYHDLVVSGSREIYKVEG